MSDLEQPTRIISDFFPARLIIAAPQVMESAHDLVVPVEREPERIPDGTYYVEVCRVVLTQNEIVVAVEDDDGVRILFRDKCEPARSYLRDDGTRSIITKTGRMLAFVIDDTCGCGARLKSWNPYRTLGATLGG